MYRVWSESEKNYIKENAGKMKDKELAAKLTELTGRYVSVGAARKQRQNLNIHKNPGRGKCSVVGQELIVKT